MADSAGDNYVWPESFNLVAPSANAPVYAPWQDQLGKGGVGGPLLNFRSIGVSAANTGLRILSGEKPENIPFQVVESETMFDWKQLQKWQIDENKLPPGSVVQFRESTFWELYRWRTIGVATFIASQTLLILWLLFMRARRKQAVRESMTFAALAKAEHKRLDDVVSNIPGIVWESRLRSGTDDRRIEFVSDYVENMLGYTPEEIASKPNFWKSVVLEEDQKKLNRTTAAILAGQPMGLQRFRCVAKDGRVIWTDAHLAATFDETGNVTGIRGVAIDVTDRERAADKLLARELELREAQRVSQIGSWEWDPECDAVTWTEELYRIAGLDPSLPTPDFEQHRKLYTPESYKRLASAMATAMERGGKYELELELIRSDKQHRWVSARGEAIRDDGSRIIKLRGTLQDITDRKKSEEAVRESEGRFRKLADTAPVIVWIADTNMLCTFFNQYILDYTGRSMEQLLGEGWLESLHHDDRELCRATYSAAYQTRKPFIMEFRVRRADGEFRWVYDTGTPRFALNGEFLGYIGSAVDIADRKAAEEALIESEERYRNVVETQTELICRYLPDTTLTFVNDAYCRYFGKSRAELIGTKFVDLIPSHARSAALSHVASLMENPSAETCEHEVILPNGARGWQQWTDRAVETSNGDAREMQGVGRDITEKRQAEAELRASETRFRIMADSAPVLIWMCGPDKLCTYVNRGWMEFTGRSLDMELGSGWTIGIHHEDVGRISEIFDSAFDNRESFKLEYRLRGADGVFRWVYDSGTPRFSSEGEFLGYIGSCVDISDRKAAEEESKGAHDEVIRLQKQLQAENIYLKEVIRLEHKFDEIIGQSDALKYVLFKIEQVAPTDATVLITGETGTGKELVARAIHSASLRKNRPLVTINCAALSASLIESELFGHEKGSFTGASTRKIGRFELAHTSTIFLDEIGELPMELQSKLLRVIEQGEFERLGNSKTMKVDVRIIAATNRDLKAEVQNGAFREDLLFRLNVFPITVPPLRERRGDIPMLIKHFVDRCAKKLGKNITGIPPATLSAFSEYSWPGNIRELANLIERSVISSNSDVLRVAEIFDVPAVENSQLSSAEPLEVIERNYIIQILGDTGWKIEGPNGAARVLGLNPSTLRTRMAKLGISKKAAHV